VAVIDAVEGADISPDGNAARRLGEDSAAQIRADIQENLRFEFTRLLQ
jgi:hypothetical protein